MLLKNNSVRLLQPHICLFSYSWDLHRMTCKDKSSGHYENFYDSVSRYPGFTNKLTGHQYTQMFLHTLYVIISSKRKTYTYKIWCKVYKITNFGTHKGKRVLFGKWHLNNNSNNKDICK
jgi:hypothetical protein